MSKSIPMLCLYRVKSENKAAFQELLSRHWDTLKAQGLVTDERASAQTGQSKQSEDVITFIERFAWKDAEAVGVAHESPEVMKIWEPMGALCTGMEFLEVEDLAL